MGGIDVNSLCCHLGDHGKCDGLRIRRFSGSSLRRAMTRSNLPGFGTCPYAKEPYREFCPAGAAPRLTWKAAASGAGTDVFSFSEPSTKVPRRFMRFAKGAIRLLGGTTCRSN